MKQDSSSFMEFNDVVNEKDEVVGRVAHKELYTILAPHRIVHVLLFDENDKLILQKRSKHKSFCPLHWSTSVGGHVNSGETYEKAALREFKEELGVVVPIEFLFKTRYDDPRGFFKFLGIFKAKYTGSFDLNTEEVESVSSFDLSEIIMMIKEGEPFHPELKFLFENHLNFIKS